MGTEEKENTNIQELKSMCQYLTAERLLVYISFIPGGKYLNRQCGQLKLAKPCPAPLGRLVSSGLSAPGLPTSREWAAPRQPLSLCSGFHLFPSWPSPLFTRIYSFVHLFTCCSCLTFPSEHEFRKGSDRVHFLAYSLLSGYKSIEVTSFFHKNWVSQ